MSTWAVAAFGAVVLATAVVPGVVLWWPSRRDAACRSDLGVALMTGTLVAFAVLGVQIMFELRLAHADADRAKVQAVRDEILRREADRRNLQLTVGLRRDLSNIDLRGRDLSGFYLAGKALERAQLTDAKLANATLWKAQLDGADLRSASLTGAAADDADFRGARLIGADLRGATFGGADLTGADMTSADLRGAKLSGANLAGATLDIARYDAQTSWPAGLHVPRCARRSCTISS